MNDITKQARIQILDNLEGNVDEMIIWFVRNGYKVSFHQNKKSIHIEVANYYFKETE